MKIYLIFIIIFIKTILCIHTLVCIHKICRKKQKTRLYYFTLEKNSFKFSHEIIEKQLPENC